MKYLIPTAVVIMIFVLPAISWWYLQSGFNYRKQVLQEIQPKGQLAASSWSEEDLASMELLFKENITVFSSASSLNNKQLDIMKRLVQKYGNRDFFQFISGRDFSLDGSFPFNTFSEDSIYLIDKEMFIRNSYGWNDNDIKKLVEHTAALLPIPKRETISLKRDLENESNE